MEESILIFKQKIKFQYIFQYLDGPERSFVAINIGVWMSHLRFFATIQPYIVNIHITFRAHSSTCYLMLKLLRIISVLGSTTAREMRNSNLSLGLRSTMAQAS